MLNHPGESLVLQTDFLYMVERVHICIDYLKSHVRLTPILIFHSLDLIFFLQRHFREAEIYLLRFQQCMTRAMTLIKMYFVGSLRALTADVSRRISEKVGSLCRSWAPTMSCSPAFIQDVSQTAQMHLLYTRFRSVSAPLSPLLGELERRANAHPEELSALLAECHSAYFSARKGLLVSRLVEEIKGLDPGRTELVELVSYLFHFYRDFLTYVFRHDRGVVISNSCVWMNLICTASSSIRARSNCSMRLLLPRYVRSLLMFTPALTSRTSATTSMTTSAPESCTNPVSPLSAKSAQSSKPSWSSTFPPPPPLALPPPIMRTEITTNSPSTLTNRRRKAWANCISVIYWRWCCRMRRLDCFSRLRA